MSTLTHFNPAAILSAALPDAMLVSVLLPLAALTAVLWWLHSLLCWATEETYSCPRTLT